MRAHAYRPPLSRSTKPDIDRFNTDIRIWYSRDLPRSGSFGDSVHTAEENEEAPKESNIRNGWLKGSIRF